jgi:fermentation-respiration switch protein FrsA (DUF1100 family)
VPYELGKKLFDAAPDPGKKLFTIDGGGHNDPEPAEYDQALEEFLERLSRSE